MELFHTSKISKGTMHEAIAMVETYFHHRHLNPQEHQLIDDLTDPGQHGWWLNEGSAQVYIIVQESSDHNGVLLRISSPLVYIPKDNREAFYRHLLDINSDLNSCALSTFDDIVLVVAQRSTLGLVQEELDELVWNTAFIADLLDNRLSQEFNAPLYSAGAPLRFTKGSK